MGSNPAYQGRRGIWISSLTKVTRLILNRTMVCSRRLATKIQVEATRCVVALGFEEVSSGRDLEGCWVRREHGAARRLDKH